MGAKVTFKIAQKGDGTFNFPGEEIEHTSANDSDFKPLFVEGQIIFVEDQKKIYLDFHGHRKCYTPDVSNTMNYVGVFSSNEDDYVFDPTEDGRNTWKIGGELIEPKEKDIAVFGTKEFMFRGGRWWEIGDEQSPEWN